MPYLLASQTHVIDLETFQFQKLEGQHDISVPIYFPDTVINELSKHHIGVKWAKSIKLNGVVTTVGDWEPDLRLFGGSQTVYMSVNGGHSISLITFPHFSCEHTGFDYATIRNGKLQDIYYSYSIDRKSYGTSFVLDPEVWPHFNRVPGLAKMPPQIPCPDEFYYGISERQYDILYKGHKLNGRSYAMLFGTWGILLSDDLKFDSFALFRGVSHEQLIVEQFVFTVNPYVVKAMTLYR